MDKAKFCHICGTQVKRTRQWTIQKTPSDDIDDDYETMNIVDSCTTSAKEFTDWHP